jgi:hypothetical protein
MAGSNKGHSQKVRKRKLQEQAKAQALAAEKRKRYAPIGAPRSGGRPEERS